jgi:hypothetical protein
VSASFNGMLIIEDHNLVVADGEDWSQVRSPARARRRRKRGFPQRIRTRYKPDTKVYRVGSNLVMHPVVADALRRQIVAERLLEPRPSWETPWPR